MSGSFNIGDFKIDFQIGGFVSGTPPSDSFGPSGPEHKFKLNQLVRVLYGKYKNEIVRIKSKKRDQNGNPTYSCSTCGMVGTFRESNLTEQLVDTEREKMICFVSDILGTDELSDVVLEKIDKLLCSSSFHF